MDKVERVAKAKVIVKKFRKYQRLAEKEADNGYINPYLGFQFTGSQAKLDKYKRLRDKAEEDLKELGYYYDPYIGFTYEE